MAQPRQLVSIPFAGGIDTKTTEYSVKAPALLELENLVFNKADAVEKRQGSTRMSSNTSIGGTISRSYGLANVNNQLLSFDGRELFSWATSEQEWVPVSPFVSTKVQNTLLRPATSTDLVALDSVVSGNVRFVTWSRRDSNFFFVHNRDLDTLSFFEKNPMSDVTGSNIKLAATNRQVLLFYAPQSGSTYTEMAYAIVPVSGTLSGTALFNDISTVSQAYDVCVAPNNAVYIANHTTGSSDTLVTVRKYNTITGSNPKPDKINQTSLSGSNINCVAVFADAQSNIYVACSNNNVGSIRWFNSDLVAQGGAQATFATLSAVGTSAQSIRRITGVPNADGRTITLAYETRVNNISSRALATVDNSLASDVRRCTFSSGSNASAGDDTALIGACGLVSKAFQDPYNQDPWALCAYETPLNSVHFLCRLTDGLVAGKAFPGLAGGLLRTGSLLPEVSFVDRNAEVIVQAQGPTFGQDGVLRALKQAYLATITFNTSSTYNATDVAGLLYIPGGILNAYDGRRVAEAGFHTSPEPLSASIESGSVALPYQWEGYYTFCYEWTDAQGHLHRSRPATPVRVRTLETSQVRVTVPYLRLTSKPDEVRLVGYRTPNLLTNEGIPVFQRFTSVATPTSNASGSYSIAFIDRHTADGITPAALDLMIAGNELLYTEGGIIANGAPPNCTLATTFANRLWIAGLDDPNLLWHSKQRDTDSAADTNDFTPAFTVQCDPRGGDITALGAMQDSLIIFKRDSIYSLFGEGPDNTGQGQQYGTPQLVNEFVGCDNPRSLVNIDEGIMFHSPKGIYLLDRSLSETYIGSEVEAYNELTITSAIRVPDSNQVRFTTLEGRTLVYDTFFKKWTTFTEQPAQAATLWRKSDGTTSYIYATPDGQFYKEDPDVYTDDGEHVTWRVALPHVQFAGQQGEQRIKEVMLLGTLSGSHSITGSFYHDFNNATPSSTASVEISNSSPQLADQWCFRPAVRKGQSLKVVFTGGIVSGSTTNDGSFSLTGVAFSVQAKAGPRRLPATKRS